jgi:hypothetical protein
MVKPPESTKPAALDPTPEVPLLELPAEGEAGIEGVAPEGEILPAEPLLTPEGEVTPETAKPETVEPPALSR